MSIKEVIKIITLVGIEWKSKIENTYPLTNLLRIHNLLLTIFRTKILWSLFGWGRCLTIQNEGLGAF